MTPHRRSYWKTVLPASFASAILVLLAGLLVSRAIERGGEWPAVVWTAWIVGVLVLFPAIVVSVLVTVGGALTLWRDTLEARGKPYGLPDSARLT